MCGIFGTIGKIKKQEFVNLSQNLSHRGPDDKGFYFDNNISLSHHRLSIIDTTKSGHQPMLNEDKNLVIIYNGEIYNFQKLRSQLLKKGHKFRSNSDTEVILHLFEEEKFNTPKLLNGIFALAIFNRKTNELFLARDHFGVKPLYFAKINNNFFFSSSIKPISKYSQYKKHLNYQALDNYFTLRYNPENETIFKKIFKLPPGSFLIAKDNKIQIQKYWQPKLSEEKINQKEAIEKTHQLLKQAVKEQLISDVPLGCHVSGGLDSSLILSLAKQYYRKKLKTFSISFDAPIDETENALYVSKIYKTDHHIRKITKRDLLAFPKLVSFLDEPFADPIILPQFILAQFASKHVKVVLTGEGADELFGGYIHHLTLPYIYHYQKISPKILQKLILLLLKQTSPSIISKFFPYPSILGKKEKEKIIKLLNSKDKQALFLNTASLFNQQEKKRLFTKPFWQKTKGEHVKLKKNIIARFKNSPDQKFLNQLIGNDLLSWLPEYILYQDDRMSMAHGLEARVPYLDVDLADFINSLPVNLKIKGLTTKYILRQIAKRQLPQEIIQRKKQAFYFPLEYYQGPQLNDLIETTLNKKLVNKRGYFKYSFINNLIKSWTKSPLLLGKQLSSLIIFELWCQNNID